jgi:hypothetical protein
MIDVSLHLRVPADATMASLRALLERIAQAENMELNTGNGFPFHAEMTVPLEAITMLREAA